MTFLLLAAFVAGAITAGPAWMAYAIKQDQERRDWAARKRARELRR